MSGRSGVRQIEDGMARPSGVRDYAFRHGNPAPFKFNYHRVAPVMVIYVMFGLMGPCS